ncbi:flagellar motor switch protein FliG [Halarcobacter anaerophilus]|jgi:flagellar motor switch protein FliG|uniref:Flagellar motor switch protein FliG n=1 Tax=Halarcobacter anaerophilus TaxID=877500 RepID=A0A4Q0XYY4_9BACT|nr:flagellar motor switch protein FliG [Halarcobacter anaerophilus]QDF29860.1 flagellar motor switch C-ring protein FliG [Halarcobacter anaerophilus]RXJ62822.1 flagellar motor switch protein FliG [Halarcobacter anaerophilus]
MAEVKDILKGMGMLEKVANFCVLIGEEATVKIFQHLPKHLVEEISTAITMITSIDKETSLAILEEFHLFTKSKSFISSGGYDYAKDILYKSLGKAEADEVLAKLSRMKLASQSFSYLDAINPKQLSDFIKDESPQTIAVILSHMEAHKAADVLVQLDEDVKVKVTMQMATIKDVSPDVVRTISVVLEKKLESLLSSIVDVGGVKVVADMLNRLGPRSQDILKNINGVDTALATKIKENMFVFEDLLNLDPEYIMKILQNVDTADVAVAMKNATEEDMLKVTSAMSQRASDRFKEEFEMLTKVKIKDIETAQRKMLDVAQKMIEEGVIDRDMDEQ